MYQQMNGLEGIHLKKALKKVAKVTKKVALAPIKVAERVTHAITPKPLRKIAMAPMKLVEKVTAAPLDALGAGSPSYKRMDADQLAAARTRLEARIASGKHGKSARAELVKLNRAAALATVTPANSGSSGVAATTAALEATAAKADAAPTFQSAFPASSGGGGGGAPSSDGAQAQEAAIESATEEDSASGISWPLIGAGVVAAFFLWKRMKKK